MINFVIAVVVILCNIVGFCHAANKVIYNSFVSKIYDSMLLWILGGTIGIIGTIIGWIYSKASWVNFKKSEQEKQDNFYVVEYGAKESELEEKIKFSPNIQKIADAMFKEIDKNNLPETITVTGDSLILSVKIGDKENVSVIRYKNLGIMSIPSSFERVLAEALAEVPSVKKYWEFNSDLEYIYQLCLRREYRLNGLNKW